MTIGMAYLIGFTLGLVLGAAIALRAVPLHVTRRFELKIDPEVLKQINGAIVAAWLERQDLVWMPKGVEFMAPKEKR